MTQIEVDVKLLKRFLECHIKEQDWGDYASQCEDLAKDILAKNPLLEKVLH